MDSFTLSAWIYPTTFDKYNAIISKVTPNRDFVLQLFKGRINSHFAINFDTYYHCFSDKQVELAKWSYIAAVWTGNKWLLYLNGSLIKESAVVDASPQWTGTRMGIGSMDDAYTFHGMIDEVKVFSRKLTAEEIMSEYSNDRKR
jgi:hypothetical protein